MWNKLKKKIVFLLSLAYTINNSIIYHMLQCKTTNDPWKKNIYYTENNYLKKNLLFFPFLLKLKKKCY